MKSQIFLVAVVISWSQSTFAACLATPEERKPIIVESCKAIVPAQDPRISGVMRNMSDESRKRIESAYTGLLLESGGSKYFVNSSIAASCSTFSSAQVVEVTIQRACCDGDPNAPCMLGTSEYISDYAQAL